MVSTANTIEYHIVYNTFAQQVNGSDILVHDEIWVKVINGSVLVMKVKTHDGINWELNK